MAVQVYKMGALGVPVVVPRGENLMVPMTMGKKERRRGEGREGGRRGRGGEGEGGRRRKEAMVSWALGETRWV